RASTPTHRLHPRCFAECIRGTSVRAPPPRNDPTTGCPRRQKKASGAPQGMFPEHMEASQPRSRMFAGAAASSAAVKTFVASMGVLLVFADGQTSSSPTPAVSETCTNGIPGIENYM
ncbi:unnamed protein product, partial [Scytosiphon promiscuus]